MTGALLDRPAATPMLATGACWLDARLHYGGQPPTPWRNAMLQVIDHLVANGHDHALFAWVARQDLCIAPGTAQPGGNSPYLRITPTVAGDLVYRCIDTAVREAIWNRLVHSDDPIGRLDRFLAHLHWIAGTASAHAPDALRIDTDRLRLREPTHADEAGVAAQWREPAGQPHILRSQRDLAAIALKVEHAAVYARLVPVADRGVLELAVERRSDGALLGTCTLAHVDGCADMRVGWHFGQAHAGQGYATEAAAALIRHAFAERGATRVIGDCFAANAASRRIFAKLGMRQHRPAWLRSLQLNRFYGEWRPMVRYSVARGETA